MPDLDEDRPRFAKQPDLAPRVSRMYADPLATLLEVDEAFTQILGWSPEEVLGKRTLDLIHPDDQELVLASWVELLATEGAAPRVRLRHLHRDGSWVWIEMTNHNLLEDPEYECIAVEMVDISGEMAMRETLHAREQLLYQLAESVPVGLLQVDAASRVIYTNDRLHFLFGIERADNVKEQMVTVIEDDRFLVEEAFGTVLCNGVDTYIEARVEQPGERGSNIRCCSLNLRALTDEAGAVTGAMVYVDDVTERVRAREESRSHTSLDTVTHCCDRSATMSALQAMINSDDRRGWPAVIFVDLDRFKDTNDTLGHAAGDEFLRVVGERLQRGIRGEDVVGRIGGDEFLVLCAGISSPTEAMRVASRLAQSLWYPIYLDGTATSPSASIGVAWSNALGMSVEKLVSRANAAMCRSRQVGDGEPLMFDESMLNSKDTLSGHLPVLSQNAS